MKKEKGIRNIYANMSVMQGTSEGMGIGSIVMLIFLPAAENRPVYEAVRKE